MTSPLASEQLAALTNNSRIRPIDYWLSDWESPAPTTNQGTSNLAFQRWFGFKEAFSPSFVHDVISSQEHQPRSILDPFSGSGTTALTAQFLGIHPYAIEVNPFLADLAEIKLATPEPMEIVSLKKTLLKKARLLRDERLLEKYPMPPTFVEPGVKDRWLFNRDVAIKILSFRAAIEELESIHQKKVGTVALGSVLLKVSNATVNGKGRRYRTNWQQRIIPDVDQEVESALLNMAEDARLARFKETVDYSLIRGDSREQIKKIDREIDLVLFSPPYPNSFDYTDVYNIELWMLGYLKNSADNRSLRSQTLRSHVQVARDLGTKALSSPTLKSAHEEMIEKKEALWNPKLPDMVCAYFDDLSTIICDAGAKLSKHGKVAVVAGDSQYAGVKVNVPKILDELLPNLGFTIEAVKTVRSMRSSPQQGGCLHLPESLITIRRLQ
ncbi:MAG: DNA methyltransferase [Campylobacterales bacterium]